MSVRPGARSQSGEKQIRHDKAAPYWAAALVVCCTIGVSTTLVDFGSFWSGYGLDITGPAWNYVLFRGRAHAYARNTWTTFFTPVRTLLIFVCVAYGIELAQYFQLYESTFDPWDLLAYISLLVPMFVIDVVTST